MHLLHCKRCFLGMMRIDNAKEVSPFAVWLLGEGDSQGSSFCTGTTYGVLGTRLCPWEGLREGSLDALAGRSPNEETQGIRNRTLESGAGEERFFLKGSEAMKLLQG